MAAAAAVALAGCDGPLSTLDPAGPSARAIAAVWWWMLGVSALVLAGVLAAWLLAMRRGRPAPGVEGRLDPDYAGEDGGRMGRRWIVGGGIVLPATAVAALLAFGAPAGLHQLPWPTGPAGPAPLRVDATGHQWWWAIHYPSHGVRLRDELRLPAGRPVDVHTRSADVIHSFWIPRLGGKIDAIPGRTNVVRLTADEPGIYRGQCAEFCGLGHARMPIRVVVMEPAAFDDWLASMPTSAPAAPPTRRTQLAGLTAAGPRP